MDIRNKNVQEILLRTDNLTLEKPGQYRSIGASKQSKLQSTE